MGTSPKPYTEGYERVCSDDDPYSYAIWWMIGAIDACLDIRTSDKIGAVEFENMELLSKRIKELDAAADSGLL